MSTDEAQGGVSNIESLAKGIDDAFMRLVYLSPFALAALLLWEDAQGYGVWAMVGGVVIAVVWALLD
ncbi:MULTISPECIES: hypothetical protein [Haloferax]|uniref:hypothetical protein n=1 Tax=Haloferax TaxID=2251 RepID=UPI0011DE1D59|nr:hypothetical protein [Haloferax sp. KTX1]